MKLKFLILVILFTIFTLISCNRTATSPAEPTPVPTVSAETSTIVQYARIGFADDGEIATVLVAKTITQ